MHDLIKTHVLFLVLLFILGIWVLYKSLSMGQAGLIDLNSYTAALYWFTYLTYAIITSVLILYLKINNKTNFFIMHISVFLSAIFFTFLLFFFSDTMNDQGSKDKNISIIINNQGFLV